MRCVSHEAALLQQQNKGKTNKTAASSVPFRTNPPSVAITLPSVVLRPPRVTLQPPSGLLTGVRSAFAMRAGGGISAKPLHENRKRDGEITIFQPNFANDEADNCKWRRNPPFPGALVRPWHVHAQAAQTPSPWGSPQSALPQTHKNHT